MSKKSSRKKSSMAQGGLGGFLRKPAGQITALVIVALVIYLIAATAAGGAAGTGAAKEITVDQAYEKFQAGAFILDVRTQEEWDDYHIEGTTLITLDALPSHLDELPKDQEIVVICHSGNRSQAGRDILLDAGFNATSVTGGLLAWHAKGYPLFTTGPVE